MNGLNFLDKIYGVVLSASISASVLGGIIWLLQYACGQRLGPGWRHALWLLVIVRLLMVSLPESRWSLFNMPRWLGWTGEARAMTVTFHEAPSPVNPMVTDQKIPFLKMVPPREPDNVSFRLICAFVWVTGCMLFLLRLLAGSVWLRWRLHRTSEPVEPESEQFFRETRAVLGTRWNPRLLRTSCVDSPGLFGCFRPKLLLPSGIGSQLSPSELQHVFLHELAHLKRADLWTNWLMSLSLAVHWFNPVVWLVLRRLRLERELACDALALRRSSPEERHSYGETILKLLKRIESPARFTASLVSVVEEKYSAGLRLRQIAQFSKSQKSSWRTGLTLLSCLTVAGLSNAQSEKQGTGEIVKQGDGIANFAATKIEPEPEDSRDFATGQSTLVRDARLLMDKGKFAEAESMINEALDRDPNDRAAIFYRGQLFQRKAQPPGTIAKVHQSAGRAMILEKLKSTHLTAFNLPAHTTVNDAILALHRQTRDSDPEGKGLNFIISSATETLVNPVTGEKREQASGRIEDFTIPSDLAMSNAPVWEVLQTIVGLARPLGNQNPAYRLAFSIEDYAVVLRLHTIIPPALYTRTYRLNTTAFRENVQSILGRKLETSGAFVQGIRHIFSQSGANFADEALGLEPATGQSAPQKALFFNDRSGVLMVRGTLEDLDAIENSLQSLNFSPPQVLIETLIIEFQPGAAYKHQLLLRTIATNPSPSTVATVTDVLTDPQFRAVINTLENRPSNEGADAPLTGSLPEDEFRKILTELKQAQGVDILGAPRITTLSGRQARISIAPGPTVDLLAMVEANGVRIRLTVDIEVPGARQKSENVNAKTKGVVNDGETFVILPKQKGNQFVILFVTPSVIDPAGNRVHAPGARP